MQCVKDMFDSYAVRINTYELTNCHLGSCGEITEYSKQRRPKPMCTFADSVSHYNTHFKRFSFVKTMGRKCNCARLFGRLVFASSTEFGPPSAKTCLRAYADSEGPDQPAHPRSLIRAFAVRKQNHWIQQNVSMESKGKDDTLRMRRMTVRILSMLEGTFFAWRGPFMN